MTAKTRLLGAVMGIAAGSMLLACGSSSDETSATGTTTASTAAGTGGAGGGESMSGTGGSGATGGAGGGGYVPPAPEPAPCDHVGKHGAITIHGIEVLDDITPPKTIWTYSPVHIKVKASAAGVAPGDNVSVPLLFGIVPPPSLTNPVNGLDKYMCPLEAVMLKGLTADVQEFDFKYVLMDDSCFKPGSEFVDKLTFTPSGQDGWYSVNLALQIDPVCTDNPAPPILYVNDLAGQAPNNECSSSQGKGCAWKLPVYFPHAGEFYIRLDETTPYSKVATVPTKTPAAGDIVSPFASVNSRIVAYGLPPKLDGPATLPGGNSLLVEYFVKNKGDGGLGDPIDVAAGDLAPGSNVSLNQFEMSKPADFEHRLYLPEPARSKLTDGAWSKSTMLTVNACVRFKGGTIDPTECRSFDIAPNRVEPKPPIGEKSGAQASQIKPVGTCIDGGYGLFPRWPNQAGSVVQVSTDAWSSYYGDASGTHGDAGLMVDVVALNNLFAVRLVDASLTADSTKDGKAKGKARVEVAFKTIVNQEFKGKMPAASWMKSFAGTCAKAQIPVGPIFATVEGCAKGNLGISASGEFTYKNAPGPKPFDKATSYGKVTLNVVPQASAGLTASAGAAVGFGPLASISAGLSGELNLLKAQMPTSGSVEWGSAATGPLDIQLSGGSKLTVNTLSGTISAYVKAKLFLVTIYDKTFPLWSFNGTTDVPFDFTQPPFQFCVQ